jgi:hypothetical protein
LFSNSGVFVGESRNPALKQTTFFCLNEQSGEVMWDEVSLQESWWIGIEAIHRDRVFLHGYSTPDLPDHKGIQALDLFTGKTVWYHADLRFLFCNEDTLHASQDTTRGRLCLRLDYRNGENVRQITEEELTSVRRAVRETLPDAPRFPSHLEDFESAGNQWTGLVRKHCSLESVVGPAKVLRVDNFLILSYHSRPQSHRTRRRFILSSSRCAVFHPGSLDACCREGCRLQPIEQCIP